MLHTPGVQKEVTLFSTSSVDSLALYALALSSAGESDSSPGASLAGVSDGEAGPEVLELGVLAEEGDAVALSPPGSDASEELGGSWDGETSGEGAGDVEDVVEGSPGGVFVDDAPGADDTAPDSSASVDACESSAPGWPVGPSLADPADAAAETVSSATATGATPPPDTTMPPTTPTARSTRKSAPRAKALRGRAEVSGWRRFTTIRSETWEKHSGVEYVSSRYYY